MPTLSRCARAMASTLGLVACHGGEPSGSAGETSSESSSTGSSPVDTSSSTSDGVDDGSVF